MKAKNEFDNRLSELKIQALGLQMNPHFIFNSLNSVHHFIAANDKESARIYLAKFGKLVRGILDQSVENSIKIGKEIELIELYLSIEKLRMGDKLEYEIIDDSNLAADSLKIPAMVIQPYVENAIWHGIGHKPQGGKIVVSFTEEKDFISVIIEDNGIGREAAKEFEKEKTHKSISTGSINDRLTLLNKDNRVAQSVKTEDLYSLEKVAIGTRVTLLIPIIG